MKIWTASILSLATLFILFFSACEQHPVSDLLRIDNDSAAASPTPGR